MGARVDGTTTGELLSVVYSSVATVPFSDAELAALLMRSRLNNSARDLTGVLLHRDGQFMQLLEGPAREVRTTLATIAADPRHSGIWMLEEERTAERRFGSWSMGYRALTAEDRMPAEWFGSPDAAGRLEERLPASRATELLAWFRDR